MGDTAIAGYTQGTKEPMVELLPFRAFRPSEPAASRLVCPVYDTLSDTDARRYSRTPHNAASFAARPTSTPLGEFLKSASGRLRSALTAGAFVQDPIPALYVYGIRYTPPADIVEALPAEERRTEFLLLGLVGCLDLHHTPPGSIARHEDTFPERIEERVRLTEATGMQFAPIMAGYTLPTHALNDLLERTLGLNRRNTDFEGTATALVRATLDGTEHRLWRLEDTVAERKLRGILEPLRILILDGHHRYGAALEALRHGRPGASPPIMLVESGDRALRLLPWHRTLPSGIPPLDSLVARAGSRFVSVESLGNYLSVEQLIGELDRMFRGQERGFLAVGPTGVVRFRGTASTDGGYDFDILHEYLADEFHLGPHDFGVFRSPRKALEAIRDMDSTWSGGIALLVPGLHEEAIEERAFSTGRVMAHKSTMFLPKVAEGVVFARAQSAPGA